MGKEEKERERKKGKWRKAGRGGREGYTKVKKGTGR